jgi:hypothetical protein
MLTRKWEDKMSKKSVRMEWIWTAVLCAVMIVCTLVMLTLCADEGIDYDESYSFKTARDNTVLGIAEKIVDDRDTDVPLYYCVLRLWIKLFGGIGHRFFAARIFSVAGTVASMILGITIIRKLWGNRTALFFIIATGLTPAMLHISVNIRMYSWTNFLVTASAILAFCIVQKPCQKRMWVLLGLCTFIALFSHYFTAFCYLVIYLYLLIELFRSARKEVWKVFVCGAISVVSLIIWMIVSEFFHFVNADSSEVTMHKISIRSLLEYIFDTDMRFSIPIGVVLVAVALVGAALFMRDKEHRGDRRFVIMSVSTIFVIYLLALVLSSFATHFFAPRHVVHALGMMWLGIAIALPRINWPVYLSGFAVLVGMSYSNYQGEYESAYRDTPYLEATKEFIDTQMEPGDIVIYSSPAMYGTLYGCYMPEQTFIHLKNVGDIQELAGKRVWYFSTAWQVFFSEEDVETYGITSQNMGHYGFQIMENYTDFDILRLEIRGAE